MITADINYYKAVTVTLSYDTTDFETTPIHKNNTQIIDSANDNLWEWEVKAISKYKKKGEIIVNVQAETPNGEAPIINPKHIPIIIEFDWWGSVWSSIYYLFHHPEYTIPSILVPFVIFILKKRKKRPLVNSEETNNV